MRTTLTWLTAAAVRLLQFLLWPFLALWGFVRRYDWEITALSLGLLNLTMVALADPANAFFQAYDPATSLMPLSWWATMFVVAGTALFVAVPMYIMPVARLALFTTATLWGFFGWAFIFAEQTPWAGVANRFAVSIIAGLTYLLASRGDADHGLAD